MKYPNFRNQLDERTNGLYWDGQPRYDNIARRAVAPPMMVRRADQQPEDTGKRFPFVSIWRRATRPSASA